eukprot:TRINITY_DN17827_c1_g1_i11.p1 TRINITY_DN17827_c1_g1~~TRINITY_DN17827_c1_g1_i11.p1  ORF type:complete len:201 (+),score=51.30 TRINITY_DN17827_c1_g1_i11:118-720(+)
MHHIYRSANLSDEDKGELLPAHQAHLSRVDEETGELLPAHQAHLSRVDEDTGELLLAHQAHLSRVYEETGELLPAHQAHLSRVDEETGELLPAHQAHLSRVDEEERRLYRTMTSACTVVVQELGIQELGPNPNKCIFHTAHSSPSHSTFYPQEKWPYLGCAVKDFRSKAMTSLTKGQPPAEDPAQCFSVVWTKNAASTGP